MVVDDVVVIRGLFICWFGEDKDLNVVGLYCNGKLVVEDIEKSNLDVVVFDIEMLEMDGLMVLLLMLVKKCDFVVIMVFMLICWNVEISLKVLFLGVVDYVLKLELIFEVMIFVDFC